MLDGGLPSMEGRTIARPNRGHEGHRFAWNVRQRPFNGGPDNCPAEPRRVRLRSPVALDHGPSMEGRTIARPNRSLDLGLLTCPFAGTCERSRKLELRRCPNSVVKLRFALWHKASSGPWDLRAHHSARIR